MSVERLNRFYNPTGQLLEKSWFLCLQKDSRERSLEELSGALHTEPCVALGSLCSLGDEVGHQEKHKWLIFIPFNLQK